MPPCRTERELEENVMEKSWGGGVWGVGDGVVLPPPQLTQNRIMKREARTGAECAGEAKGLERRGGRVATLLRNGGTVCLGGVWLPQRQSRPPHRPCINTPHAGAKDTTTYLLVNIINYYTEAGRQKSGGGRGPAPL